MGNTLYAGVGRRVINAALGTRKVGMRIFGDPIPAYESDLTGTVLVLGDGVNKVAIIATDLAGFSAPVVDEVRHRVAEAIGVPPSNIMLNGSHNHSSPALPGVIPDTPEQMIFKNRYKERLVGWLGEAAAEANQSLRKARIGAGWGEVRIGVYRREIGPDGKGVLGEVPDARIDPAVGVVRVDDLEGNPIAILFSCGCHAVTMGPRAIVGSADFPGPAREVVERTLGGMAMFLQGCGGNIDPTVGIGYEVDCRDNKNRTGIMLGAEVLKVACDIRTHVRRGPRTTLGNVPNILFTPWIPVEGNTCSYLGVAEEVVKLHFVDLPTMEEAVAIRDHWKQVLSDRQAKGAQEWEIRVAFRFARWSEGLVEAVRNGHPTADLNIQVLRINDIVIAGLNVEAFFETGLAIKARSPFQHTLVLGYTNGSFHYLPRAEDYPKGGWKLGESYALPDMLFQGAGLPVALHPDSERTAVERTSALIQRLAV